MCGTTNKWILKAPLELAKRDFVFELLTLFIPEWVEDDQIAKIAKLAHEINPEIPITILAFFPAHKMKSTPPPSLPDMVRIYQKVREIGLNNVKLGNCGVFARTAQDWEHLLKKVGKEGIG